MGTFSGSARLLKRVLSSKVHADPLTLEWLLAKCLPAGLICNRHSFGVVDDEYFERSLSRLQLQPKLLLHSRKNRSARVPASLGMRLPRRVSPFQLQAYDPFSPVMSTTGSRSHRERRLASTVMEMRFEMILPGPKVLVEPSEPSLASWKVGPVFPTVRAITDRSLCSR